MKLKVLVTGASGNVGREVVSALQKRDVAVRAADFAPEKAREILGSGVDIVQFDFTAPSTWHAALSGCSAVFLLRPPAISQVRTTLNPFVDAAREADAAHVVFLSVAGAGKNKFIPHHKVEAHLQARSAPYTILRPGFFAQNLQDAYRLDIAEDDRIYVPAGAGRVAFVDLQDVAEVAAAAFRAPKEHAMKAYTLTGSTPVTFRGVAQTLSDVLGRPIQYEPASVIGYLRHLRRRQLGWGQSIVQTMLHAGLRFGQAAKVDPTLEQLLNRPARSMDEYVRANTSIWARSDPAR